MKTKVSQVVKQICARQTVIEAQNSMIRAENRDFRSLQPRVDYYTLFTLVIELQGEYRPIYRVFYL